MQAILVAGYTAFFLFLIRRFRYFCPEGVQKQIIPMLFMLKVLAGIVLGLIYTYHYSAAKTTSDSIKFFEDSGFLFDSIHYSLKDFLRMMTGIGADDPHLSVYYDKMGNWTNTNILFNDNKTVIRLNAFFRFFSMGYYYVHVVFINFLSLIGLTGLIRIFIHYCPENKNTVALTTMFMPSVLFWGSGLLKDPVMISMFGLLLYMVFQIREKGFSSTRIILFSLLLFSLFFIKMYVMVTAFPGLLVMLFSKAKTNNLSLNRRGNRGQIWAYSSGMKVVF